MPSLQESANAYRDHGIEHLLATQVRDIFLKHRAHESWNMVLVHQHFKLQEFERLVHVENASFPWNSKNIDLGVMERVLPTLWQFSNEVDGGPGITPFEFEYVSDVSHAVGSKPDLGFLEELHEFLRTHNLLRYLGIAARHPQSTGSKGGAPVLTEITRGRVNITMPFGLAENDSTVQVLWSFSPDPTLGMECVLKCYDENGSHLEFHT